MARSSLFSFGLALLPVLAGAQTLYYPKDQVIFGGSHVSDTPSSTVPNVPAATFTGAAAYNQAVLTAPAAPTAGALNTNFGLQLSSSGMTNMSRTIPSNFFGFSIEMSVFNQFLGKNSSQINVPFLNLVANVVERNGGMQIRVGGNSQETAELVAEIPNGNGSIISKDLNNIFNHNTPPIEYTADLFYMMNNISNLVAVDWFLGIPFFTTNPFNLDLAVVGTSILGDRLLALQAGNEPDLYDQGGRNHRNPGYSPTDYMNEIGSLIQQVAANGSMPRQENIWLVASVSTANTDSVFSPDLVWNTGIVSNFSKNLYGMTVERYPENNCAALFNTGATIVNPQDVLGNYLNHGATTALQGQYAYTAQIAVENNMPLIMFETNTASCSGFVGISDAFVGALWGVDWALSLAAGNFSGVLFHFGGQSSFYNPFTPPPGNQSHFRQWTVGPTYYSTLVVAEALGKSNKSQVVDLFANSNNGLTPAWAIYENGAPTKVVIINYANDPSGASTITANIGISGASNPSSVRVKRLSAASVVQKGNFTWAGQTLGNAFESDGRLQGSMQADTVQCDPTNGCPITVPAPGAALVFLTDAGFNEVSPDAGSTVTFATTTHGTKTLNTAVINPTVLATSNGHSNVNDMEFTTSPGSRSAGARTAVPGVLVAILGAAAALGVLVRRR